MEVEVDPPDLYPVIEKFIAERIEEGFSALGAEVKRITVRVFAEGSSLGMDIQIILEKESGLLPEELPAFASSILERAVETANETFGALNNVRFYVKKLDVREIERTDGDLEGVRINITSPVQRDKVEKLAKGIVLWLIDRHFLPKEITIDMVSEDPPAFTVRLEVENSLDTVERKDLEEAIADKIIGYAETLFGSKASVKGVSIVSPAGNTPHH